MEMTQFLRRTVGLTTAIGGLHKRELIHKDVKPANDLVNPATGQVSLIGAGWLRARPTADSREIVRVVMNRILALLVPIIACWMVTIPVIAQTTSGSISGTVTDALPVRASLAPR
jgi:serine/threonine protein kinase